MELVKIANYAALLFLISAEYPPGPTFGILFFHIFATLVYFKELPEKLKTPKKDMVDRINLSKNLFL
jgi:hypothetical protein